ncbi:hypothetical protein ACJRO7_004687 [Eucalyptus globulus]|uniref:Cytochrome P450 n=1 Tax=Eucalyptus globulus TaxID=34317 RepID=A0ABD3IXH9_EUCGL
MMLQHCIAAAFIFFFVLFLYLIEKLFKLSARVNPRLPPGSLGWPLIGETQEFLRAGWLGEPERFIRERMDRHDTRVFKTSLLGEPMFVFCGTAGHKFLFGNENKAVKVWWPITVQKLFRSSLVNTAGEDAKSLKRMLMNFFHPEALKRDEVRLYPMLKIYTMELACRIFTSTDDPTRISNLAALFDVLINGVMNLPISFPGTAFHRSTRAANRIREEIRSIIMERKLALWKEKATPDQDLLSFLLTSADANGRFLSEMEIIDNILLILFAGHDTTRSAITLLMKYLSDYPEVYENICKEHEDIAKSKELAWLQWKDLQKMRYSMNVVAEVMRLMPPVTGAFREALVDFTYAGYTIPKGWKLYWSTGSTHKDPVLYPNPEKFDASRFEGSGSNPFSYVPFGGGPRMCLGHEFARINILIFLHNMVTRFKWNVAIPDEAIGYDPMLSPQQGLPLRLLPRRL